MCYARLRWLTAAGCFALAVSLAIASSASAKVFEKSAHGKPAIVSIDSLSFAPDGVLLIGDGRGAQLFAIQTGEKGSQRAWPAKIENIQAKLAERLGAKPDGIEIVDLAVNPATGKAYLAVRKQDDKAYLLMTIDGDGQIEEFRTDSVDYARVALAPGDSSPVNKITDVAWADDRVLIAAAAAEEFASKIYVIAAPLAHEAQGQSYSAETYHVSHHRWETKAPMSAIIPYRENGKMYVVGAFACTPIVKYPLDALSAGAKVKGISVIELGSGNRPLDMFSYEKGGQQYVLANSFRPRHAQKPISPSPYWTVRFERGLLGENEKINEKAPNRLSDDPAAARMQMVDTFHGVMQMDQLNATQALVLRTDGQGHVDLETLDLP
jgi:hypothetical protein